MDEVWINVRREDGGQHDDMGHDTPRLRGDDWRENLVTIASWATTQCRMAARGTLWPGGVYEVSVWSGRERSGDQLTPEFKVYVCPDRDCKGLTHLWNDVQNRYCPYCHVFEEHRIALSDPPSATNGSGEG